MRHNGLYIFIISLMCFSCGNEKGKNISNPTFVEVAPILYKNCTPCHRPGEGGPFLLTNYDEAVQNAKKIKFVTGTRYMPPWPADPSYSHFIGERRLSDDEIELIKNWVDQGCKKGDEHKFPPLPDFYVGSFFGKPDTVLYMKRAVPLAGNGTDHFYIIKFPMELKQDTFVRCFEFVPDNRKLAHHINGHLVNFDSEKKKDVLAGIPYAIDEYKDYKQVFEKMGVLHDDGSFPVLVSNTVYYLPGYSPPIYPENIGGYHLNKKSVVLLKSAHYGPSLVDTKDSSKINVFYGPKPKRPIQETQLGTFGVSKIEPELILLPNQIQTFHTQATLGADISLLSVNPHMHLLGKTFWAFAVDPHHDTIPLIKIDRWDFRWQYYYTYKHPIKLSAGTTIHVYGTYDNTNQNPFNPFHPPRKITQGEGIKSMKTTEEMFQFIFSYLPYQTGDEFIDLETGSIKN